MTPQQARTIAATYDAYCRRNGREWADRHYLRAGTPGYSANLRLLEEARRVVAAVALAEGGVE